MTIHHGVEDPYEVPEDYDARDEIEDFLRWRHWHDEHCSDVHYERVFEPLRRVETIDPGPYL